MPVFEEPGCKERRLLLLLLLLLLLWVGWPEAVAATVRGKPSNPRQWQ